MQLERSCLRLQLSFKERFYEPSLSSTCILEIQLLVEAMSPPDRVDYTRYCAILIYCDAGKLTLTDLINSGPLCWL